MDKDLKEFEKIKNLSKEEQDKILKESEELSKQAKLIKAQRHIEKIREERKETKVVIVELNEQNILNIDNRIFVNTDDFYIIFASENKDKEISKLERRGLLLSIEKYFRPIQNSIITINFRGINYYPSNDSILDDTYNRNICLNGISEFISEEELNILKDNRDLLCVYYKKEYKKWSVLDKILKENNYSFYYNLE